MNTVKVAERTAVIPSGTSRESCIRLLAQEAAALWFPGMEAPLAETALERESAESTYIGRGLAVPHARVPGLASAALYIAQGADIPWAEEHASCIALLCVPAEQPELHLQLLSKIVRWRMKGGALQLG